VIGLKGNIGRFSRDDLLGFVESRYVGANIVVGVAGGIDAEQVVAAVEKHFGALRAGVPGVVPPPTHRGGTGSKAIAGWARRTSSTACRSRRSPTRRSTPMPSPRRCSAKA
jgi:hypothetical protein